MKYKVVYSFDTFSDAQAFAKALPNAVSLVNAIGALAIGSKMPVVPVVKPEAYDDSAPTSTGSVAEKPEG